MLCLLLVGWNAGSHIFSPREVTRHNDERSEGDTEGVGRFEA